MLKFGLFVHFDNQKRTKTTEYGYLSKGLDKTVPTNAFVWFLAPHHAKHHVTRYGNQLFHPVFPRKRACDRSSQGRLSKVLGSM